MPLLYLARGTRYITKQALQEISEILNAITNRLDCRFYRCTEQPSALPCAVCSDLPCALSGADSSEAIV